MRGGTGRVFAICIATLILAGCQEEEVLPIDTAAAARGEALAEDCKACHALNRRANRVGPHLQGVVGREVASVRGYDYSDALIAHGGIWTPERLADFILAPTEAVPGTKMAYGGITSQEADDIVEYLRSLGDLG